MSAKIEQAVKSLLSKAQRHSVAEAIVQSTDKGGQVNTLRAAMLAQFRGVKGLAGKALPDAEVAMIGDECSAMYSARDTISEASVPALVSAAKKIARCGPIVANLDRQFPSVDGLKKFCTLLQKMEFNVKAAETEYDKARKPDYAKSAAIHIRSVLGMTGKAKFLTAESKAALVAWADEAGLKIGERADDYRDTKKAKSFLS